MADNEAFTEPVVNAVVVVVQKAEKNPPILVSIPAPEGRFGRNPIMRSNDEESVCADEDWSGFFFLSQQSTENKYQCCGQEHH